MLSGLYYKALRQLLLKEAPPLSVNFVNERSGVFADALQETMLATYRRGGSAAAQAKVGFVNVHSSGRAEAKDGGTFKLPARLEAPWLLPRTDRQIQLVQRLLSMPHRLSDYGYTVSTGPLVWNRHKNQLKQKQSAGTYPVIWAESVTSDGQFIWRSEKRNHAPWFDAKLPKDRWLIVTEPCVLLQRTTAKDGRALPGRYRSAVIAIPWMIVDARSPRANSRTMRPELRSFDHMRSKLFHQITVGMLAPAWKTGVAICHRAESR